MSSPAVVIRLEFEGSPKVRTDAEHEGDVSRLVTWLEGRPELLGLVKRAVALEDEARKA
jgi:hypothetical protein